MPKLAKDAIPNELLRYERERRNLTQEEVAHPKNLTPIPPRQWRKKYGKKPLPEEDYPEYVDPKMVGRWERGTLIPSRHYQRQLATLFGRTERELGYPKEGIPFWDVKYKQNELFTGREEILSQLADLAYQRNHYNKQKPEDNPPLKQRPQVLTGVGGVGKTQIAVAYAYRYQHEYHTIIWLNTSSLAELTSGFARIAEVLRLVDEQDVSDQRKMIAEAQTWLSSKYLTRWLLIFDNVDSPEIIHGIMSLLPQNYYGHVLLFSRLDDPGAEVYGLQQIRVRSMMEEEGTTFLLRRAGLLDIETSMAQATQDDQQQALVLSRSLDELPLALDQAGAYIRETPITLQEYAKLHETRRAEFLRHRGNYGFSHPESVVVTWLLNFEQLVSEAQELLRFFAFLAPDDIPEELATSAPQVLGTILGPVASDKERLRDTVKNLRRYSFISRYTSERAYTIHRLVQAVTQDEMEKDARHQWKWRAMYSVYRLFADTDIKWKNTSEWWRKYERFLPHAFAWLALMEKGGDDAPWLYVMSQLFSSVSHYLYQCVRYEEAYEFYKYAEALQRYSLGEEHQQAVRARNNRGVLSLMIGRYGNQIYRDNAWELLMAALRISKGRYELENAVITNNIGVLLHFEDHHLKGDKDKHWAAIYYKFAIVKLKELNAEQLLLSSVRANLAQLYREQGRYEEARAVRQQDERPDVFDAFLQEGIQQVKTYLTGGPDVMHMEQTTEFPMLPSLLSALNDMFAQAKEKSGITSTELAALADIIEQFYKIYSEQGSEKALAFFKEALKPYGEWREENDAIVKEFFLTLIPIIENIFRFTGPEFDNTSESDVGVGDVGQSLLLVYQQLLSLSSKGRKLFPIWLSDLDDLSKLLEEAVSRKK